MEKAITDQQKEVLKKLMSASNIIANAVWMAENTESDVDGQIKMAIDLGTMMINDAKEMIKEPHTVV